MGWLIDEFFLPYLEIRIRRAGYAVSISKAGARLVGYDDGPLRLPVVGLTIEETENLQAALKSINMMVFKSFVVYKSV